MLRHVPRIGFRKVCGSGSGQGFTPVPNTAVYAILATWPDLENARRQTRNAAVFRRYRSRAEECWTVFLSPTSAREAWSGQTPFEPQNGTAEGPVAALTRASLRPSATWRFWQRVPDISRKIGENTQVVLNIGIGEIPLFNQITFSIWPDTAAMAGFARADGPHCRAVRAVRAGG